MVDRHGLFRARCSVAKTDRDIALYAPEPVPEKVAGLEDPDARAGVADVFDWHPPPPASAVRTWLDSR
jgi:hypothetical protein